MRLSSLLEALPAELAVIGGAPTATGDDPTIRGIRYDSRQVAPGDLFVALRGATADGHDYLDRAIELGAAALLVEADAAGSATDASRPSAIPVVRVPDTRRALAPIAARFFGEPARELEVELEIPFNSPTAAGAVLGYRNRDEFVVAKIFDSHLVVEQHGRRRREQLARVPIEARRGDTYTLRVSYGEDGATIDVRRERVGPFVVPEGRLGLMIESGAARFLDVSWR